MSGARIGLAMALLACLWSPGCAGAGDDATADDQRRWDGVVRSHGALREMFHEGKTGATIDLGSLLPNPDLFAVGALADLAGEVTVVGGTAYVARAEGGDETRTEMTLRTDAEAALLVVSEVPAWREAVTERAIPFAGLDDAIAALASAEGISTGEPFPFVVEGEVENLQWHVIDGRRLIAGGTSHNDHLAAAVKGWSDRAKATLVGFYSERDQGVFTHMGSRTHLHSVIVEPLSTGHVDRVDIPAGTTIRFPAVENVTRDAGRSAAPGPPRSRERRTS